MNKIRTALISVSDKKNLSALLSILKKYKIKIISSGGTFKEIKKLGFNCIEVSNFTKSPEILDGRVKTLHPKIHGGILNVRNNKKHIKEVKINNLENIDLVIINFYPFEEAVKNTSDHKKIIETIDIGGPTLARAAAKNYNDVTVLTSPDQYIDLAKQLKNNNGSTSLEFRKKMSQYTFSETAFYDSLIADYFNEINYNHLPIKKIIQSKLVKQLRFGENPHQKSGIYSIDGSLNLKQLHGKQLSYNNFNDIYAALTISKTLPNNKGLVIVKHANPCGVSIIKNKLNCYQAALACDPISAFGGIVSCNFKIDSKLATELNKIFLEVVIANNFEKDALKILKRKKNLRLIDASSFVLNKKSKINSFNNAILFQDEDQIKFTPKNFKVVSKLNQMFVK